MTSLPMAAGVTSLAEKIGQMMMIGFGGTDLPQTVRERLEAGAAGFVVLFYHNVRDAAQVVNLTNGVHGCRSPSPMIWADQEGGNVVQFGEMAATGLSAMGLAATGKRSIARRAGRLMAADMARLGVDGVLAPVLDVNTRADNPIIGFRAFSDRPRVVRRFAAALAGGLRSAGVATCGKHFPGHGGVELDSHADLPTCPAGMREINTVHLAPFRGLIRSRLLDAVMPAHVVYPAVTPAAASFSSFWLQRLLRDRLGFHGPVISDCLEMGAVARRQNPGEAAVRAVEAGVDVITVTRSARVQEEVFQALLTAVREGRLSEGRIDAAVTRILELKRRRGLLEPPAPRDADAVAARMRPRYREELAMALASITLVRDRGRRLPLKREQDLLLLEWNKVVATEALGQGTSRMVLAAPLARRFPRLDARILQLESPWPVELDARLTAADTVVAAVFSRYPAVEAIQAAAVRRLLARRPDAVVVALGNPYDLRGFPDAGTFLAAYGYRRVQAEALAAVLAGESPPRGRLPVRLPPPADQLSPQGGSLR